MTLKIETKPGEYIVHRVTEYDEPEFVAEIICPLMKEPLAKLIREEMHKYFKIK